ncbi:MAG: hypothetical protein QXW82_07400 [Candidatus Bathyarchaeia archaeon]
MLIDYGLMLVVFGDMFGLLIPTYYRLRLLPYWLPRLSEWKIFLLREKDVTEKL